MSGTREGGLKTAQTNYVLHGRDFYKRIGQKGGSHSTPGGFGTTKVGKDGLTGVERSKVAGAKGGRTSRRGKDPRVERIWQQNRAKVHAWRDMGIGLIKISKMVGLSPTTVKNRLNEEKQKGETNGESKRVHVGNRSLRDRLRARMAHRDSK